MPPENRSIRVRFRALRTKGELFNTKDMVSDANRLIREHLAEVVKTVQEYPPPRPARPNGYRYVRTRRLYKGWRYSARKTSGGFIGTIYNEASYATFVQGPYQTAMHRKWGWKKLTNYLERKDFQKRLRKFAADRFT
jgi:hypothetical protein